MLKETLKGALVASAVASLFMAGAATAQEKTTKTGAAKVQCKQDNGCGGQGACAGKDKIVVHSRIPGSRRWASAEAFHALVK